MPETTDMQDAEPGEESLEVILGALNQDAGTLRWPKSPEPSGMEPQPGIIGTSLSWVGEAEPAAAEPAAAEPAAAEPAAADGTPNLADQPSEQALPTATVVMAEESLVGEESLGRAEASGAVASSADHAPSETNPEAPADGGPGASIEEAGRRTGRSGVRPVQVIKRHPGTTVLAAGALVALAGGAVLGGWVKPVSVSLPGTHTILVDPSSHSDSPPGAASLPATTPSTAPSTSTTSPSAPPSSVANTPTGPPVTSPAPSASAGSAPSQGTNSSSSTTPSAGTSSTSAPSDASGTSGGTSTPPPSSGSPSGDGGSTPTPPPVTTPPTTPPSGGTGSGGLAGVLSGVVGALFGSN
jgi:hypothetical protein